MRGITRVAISLFVALFFGAPAGSALAAATSVAPNPAQSVNIRLSDLPRGFVAGVNGIEQHDDDTAAHKQAAYADDKDYYWKNANGSRSVEVSTTVEWYRKASQAVSFMPDTDTVVKAAKAGLAKMPASAHMTVQACSIGEACMYNAGLFYKSPVGDVLFRHGSYIISVFVCETGTNLPVHSVDKFAQALALKVAGWIDGAKH
jgi:hypothetical protein